MIYLVRHGQTDWNIEKKTQGHTDIPLNETGILQAYNISNNLKKLKIDKIYSSDLQRAHQTAEIINEQFNLNVILDNRLREINYGDLEGISRTTLNHKIWDIFNDKPEQLHAEPIDCVFKRIKSFIDELDINKNILIVTHGGALRMIMYYVNNKEFSKDEYDKNYRNMKINNVSVYEWNTKNNKLEAMIF